MFWFSLLLWLPAFVKSPVSNHISKCEYLSSPKCDVVIQDSSLHRFSFFCLSFSRHVLAVSFSTFSSTFSVTEELHCTSTLTWMYCDKKNERKKVVIPLLYTYDVFFEVFCFHITLDGLQALTPRTEHKLIV